VNRQDEIGNRRQRTCQRDRANDAEIDGVVAVSGDAAIPRRHRARCGDRVAQDADARDTCICQRVNRDRRRARTCSARMQK
jgi:hypothetical protein